MRAMHVRGMLPRLLAHSLPLRHLLRTDGKRTLHGGQREEVARSGSETWNTPSVSLGAEPLLRNAQSARESRKGKQLNSES